MTMNQGDANLLKLAGILDNAQFYDQKHYFSADGPSCAMGHWLYDKFKTSRGLHEAMMNHCIMYEVATRDFQIGMVEYEVLFGAWGCNDAGSDSRKAAAFIRHFVATRQQHGIFAKELRLEALMDRLEAVRPSLERFPMIFDEVTF